MISLKRILPAFLMLAASGWVSAAPYCDPRVNAACYRTWCENQGGKPVYRGNWGCDVSGGGGSSGGGGGYGGAEIGEIIGGALGAMIRDGLFGNPQQDAERQAAIEAQRQWEEQERARLAAEKARQDEERYQKLRGSLLDFNPPPQMSLQLDSPQGAGGLRLLVGDEAEGSLNPAHAQLARAAAWSTLAARAPSPEDAAMLADAAFQGLVGGKISLPPPPPDVKGVPVGPQLKEVEPLKKNYLALRDQGKGAAATVNEAEERRAYFERLERESRRLEQNAKEAARKQQARAAAKEAQQLREKAEAELRAAQNEFRRQQMTINDIEQALRALLSAMAAAPRRPDSYFYLGFEDGSQCLSQNAGPRCDKARAPASELQSCVASYRAGYSAGEKIKVALLKEANQRGQRDRQAGRTYADTDARALGPCRYDYVMAYNRGHFSASPAPVAMSAAARPTAPAPAAAPVKRKVHPDDQRAIDSMLAHIKRTGWTDEEQTRIEKALYGLPPEKEKMYSETVIIENWEKISGRFKKGEHAADAAQGAGPGLYGAGTQSKQHTDCALYALATASGQPYEVVAARANELIREAPWRSATDHANPQGVFSLGADRGLFGGEVILLAEAFGQVKVAKPAEFPQALKAGQAVMVNVIPRSGNIDGAHQIVLAKTFQHRGETWYEAIDSAEGPMRRLYLNAGELDEMIKENGIVYQPEPSRR